MRSPLALEDIAVTKNKKNDELIPLPHFVHKDYWKKKERYTNISDMHVPFLYIIVKTIKTITLE